MTHLWKSLGQKRTIAIKYRPEPACTLHVPSLTCEMPLGWPSLYAFVDARLNGGRISPITLRKKVRPWFLSSMPYARHHINPVCSKAVALLKAYRKKHKKLALPSLEKLSMRIRYGAVQDDKGCD